jgi:hypothetical protein
MSALDYLIEAATQHPEITIEVTQAGVRITSYTKIALGSRKIPWSSIKGARINPILIEIELLRSKLKSFTE